MNVVDGHTILIGPSTLYSIVLCSDCVEAAHKGALYLAAIISVVDRIYLMYHWAAVVSTSVVELFICCLDGYNLVCCVSSALIKLLRLLSACLHVYLCYIHSDFQRFELVMSL